MKKLMAVMCVMVMSCTMAISQEKERSDEGVGLTIYSKPAKSQQQQYYYGYQNPQEQGYAVVKEWRKLKLDSGRNVIRFEDIAAMIDATTVNFKSLTDPKNTLVVEQNYEYDLVNADKIMSKYIDKEIVLEDKDGREIKGTLLSFDGSRIVLNMPKSDQPIQIINRGENIRNIRCTTLPGGLITKPTLMWLIDAKKAGEHLAKVTYQTNGMGWNADYTLVTNKDDTTVDLSGWVTIKNNSGAMYKNSELKLVAGDVHRVTPEVQQYAGGMAKAARADELQESRGFAEKAFFEYHLYTLGRKTTLPNNSIKQLELIDPAEKVPAKKIFVYDGAKGFSYYGYLNQDQNFGAGTNKKVDTYMEFENKKEVGLGIPLPAGKIRVYKKDEDDGSLEFIGEDEIDHTPKDEKIRITLGEAFDIVGERKQTGFKTRPYWIKESFEIKVKNHKDTDVDVLVKERMYRWTNWEITESSHEYKKLDAFTVHFPIKVKASSEEIITYNVEYTWH